MAYMTDMSEPTVERSTFHVANNDDNTAMQV